MFFDFSIPPVLNVYNREGGQDKKTTNVPLIDWIKMWYIYIIEFAETHDEILPFTKTWLES